VGVTTFRRWKALTIVFGLACVSAVWLAALHPGPARAKATSVIVSARSCIGGAPSLTLPACLRVGHRIPRSRPPFKLVRPGTVVRSRAVSGERVFLNDDEGVALATGKGAQYPVLSIDGGREWRIVGPPLHVDAADGAEGVGFVGIANARTFYAYGSSVVDVSSDRGRTWWESFLGEDVVSVALAPDNALVALVEQTKSNRSLSPTLIWQYVSHDGGRHWRYTTQLESPFPA
jgi:hypothetical protein